MQPTTLFSLLLALVNPITARQAPMGNEPVFICFEGTVRPEQAELGRKLYAQMSELVETQPGFISQTPFRAVDQDFGQVLYVRFDNERHLHQWKNNPVHLAIQAKGRADIFADYRLRIGNEAFAGEEPKTTNSTGKYLLLWRHPTIPNDSAEIGFGTDIETNSSVWRALVDAATYVGPNGTLRISSWPTEEIGLSVKAAIPRRDGDDLRLIRVKRDYGPFQRQEAPCDADRCQAAAAMNDTTGLERCKVH